MENGEFTRLTARKKGDGELPARDVLACFGTPSAYRALHGSSVDGGDYQEFDLFFSDVGIIAHGYRLDIISMDHSTRPIKDSFPISDFIITRPGTVDAMLTEFYGNAYPYNYGAIRSWPGDWEDIVIDTTPEIQRWQSTQ